MCVAVSLMPGATLSHEEILRMGTQNGDGIGIAWVKDGAVHWYKTLRYKVGFVANALKVHEDRPRLVHFRYATVGGTRVELCHPFAIDEAATCDAVGRANKVMIHNGHFGRWQELFKLMEKEGILPGGPWSDTRLVALMASKDIEWLEVLGGRVVTLDKDGQFSHLGDWSQLRDGVKVSNRLWDHEPSIKQGGYSGYKEWKGWDKSWEGEEAHKKHEELQAKKVEAANEAQQAAKVTQAVQTTGGGVGDGTSKAGAGGERLFTAEELAKLRLDPRARQSYGHHGSAREPGGGHPVLDQGGARRAGSGGGGGLGAAEDAEVREPAGKDRPRSAKGVARSYDGTPYRSPETGRVYQADAAGNLVEITPPLDATGKEGGAGAKSRVHYLVAGADVGAGADADEERDEWEREWGDVGGEA